MQTHGYTIELGGIETMTFYQEYRDEMRRDVHIARAIRDQILLSTDREAKVLVTALLRSEGIGWFKQRCFVGWIINSTELGAAWTRAGGVGSGLGVWQLAAAALIAPKNEYLDGWKLETFN